MKLLQDTDGKPSFSRIAGSALIAAYIGCALWRVVAQGHPMPDMPVVLSGTALALYGINRTADAVKDVFARAAGREVSE